VKLTQHLWFPGGLVLLLAVVVHLWTPARDASAPFLTVFCALTLAVGAVLAVLYNRSRSLAALVLLGAATWLLPHLYATRGPADWLLQTLALLLPLNLLLFTALPDQGVRAPASLISGAALVAQAFTLLLLPPAAAAWLAQQLARTPLPRAWFRWSEFNQPALLAFLLAALLLAAFYLWRRRPTTRGLFWAVPALFLGLHAAGDRSLALLYFGAAALILTISLAEHAHAMAYLDALTGLPNRRALDELLPQLLGRFSLAMVDVDHFKKFNDTYGHDAGDQVLRKVGRHLAAAPGGGRAFRYGGEEFTVVFPGLGKKEAEPYLEALRARIEEAGFSLRGVKRPKKKPKERRATARGGKKVHVTVSIGLAECGEKFTSAPAVIAAADKALYAAKQAGRNQVQSA
jgi:diguanylate cyclase (GGDEF)-like protein